MKHDHQHPPTPPPVAKPAPATAPPQSAARNERAFACLLCGAPMAGGHCKLRCPQCGYIEDCSDLFRADSPSPPRDPRG